MKIRITEIETEEEEKGFSALTGVDWEDVGLKGAVDTFAPTAQMDAGTLNQGKVEDFGDELGFKGSGGFEASETVMQTILKEVEDRKGIEISFDDVVVPSYCVGFLENLTDVESQSFDFGNGDVVDFSAEDRTFNVRIADDGKRKIIQSILDMAFGVLNNLGKLERHLGL